MTPTVSVVIPVHNGERFLPAAIESVQAQTFTDFELLVIDDGSTDATARIVARYQQADGRVHLLSQAQQGVGRARNTGVSQSRGKYLAWLDADDLAHPQRLEAQVIFLETHPDVVILGAAFRQIDENGQPVQTHFMPQDDTEIRWHALFHSPFAQSTVMQRLDTFRCHQLAFCDRNFAEDYELSSRMLGYGRGANLAQPLSDYRFHAAQITTVNSAQIGHAATEVARNNILKTGMQLDLDTVAVLRQWYYRYPRRLAGEEIPLALSLLDLVDQFDRQPGLDQRMTRRIRGKNVLRFCRAALGNPGVWSLAARNCLQRDRLPAALAYSLERIGMRSR